jgi:5-methyltetrahydropteroyltriglutamate--homocysteine methyltransferase
VLGPERVIAANDCGFATAAAGDQVHPDVAWAKLNALVEEARLASRELWGVTDRSSQPGALQQTDHVHGI